MWPIKKKNRYRLVKPAYAEQVLATLCGILTLVMLVGVVIMGFAL